jgi:NAD-dependent dihydropyrimidine dehydrogenase PreA subunit
MALRKIVKIDDTLCNGCGDCVPSCAEGAIQIIDGKARLMADNLCDGLGACLGDCPQGAITIEERDAEEYDESAVEKHLAQLRGPETSGTPGPLPINPQPASIPSGCPGSRVMQFAPSDKNTVRAQGPAAPQSSELGQWPVQLHLVPPMAPYFMGADVLLAADCTAFAVGDFHTRHLKSKALAIACPKLDQGQQIYLQKLVAMIDEAQINTLTVLIMQVPCCAGLVAMAKEAATMAKRKIPVKQIVVSVHGEVLNEEWVMS